MFRCPSSMIETWEHLALGLYLDRLLVLQLDVYIRYMGLLSDAQNCGLRMRRKCRERFSRHRLQMKPLVSDPDMHHGTCVTHVPWCMSASLTHSGGENVPGIPGACATRNFTYLARGPLIPNILGSCPLSYWWGCMPRRAGCLPSTA